MMTSIVKNRCLDPLRRPRTDTSGEPAGGSPTGVPARPVIFKGRRVRIL